MNRNLVRAAARLLPDAYNDLEFVYQGASTILRENLDRNIDAAERDWNRLLKAAIRNCGQHEARAEVGGVGGKERRVAGTGAAAALDGLLHALQKHRLGFLYVAVPKRPAPNGKGLPERMYSDELPANQVRPVDGEDEDDDKFLFRHRAILERFADDAISQFGPGKGTKADVPGGQYPHWVLDEPVCQMLEQSSEELLEACKRLRTTDAAGVYHGLIQQVMSVAYDKGQSRWSSAIIVQWEYLDDLDKAIAALKKARVAVPCPEPRTEPACKQAMPTYFLTAQLPYMVLGADASSDPDLALDPNLTHENWPFAGFQGTAGSWRKQGR